MKRHISIFMTLFSIFTYFLGFFVSDVSAGITVELTAPSDFDEWIPTNNDKLTFTVTVSHLHTKL